MDMLDPALLSTSIITSPAASRGSSEDSTIDSIQRSIGIYYIHVLLLMMMVIMMMMMMMMIMLI